MDVTTGLGYPKKANDARANPLVSLLFSDPTGSGLRDAPMVLVQGTADVDDRDLEANRARYARESAAKLPAISKMMPPERDPAIPVLVLHPDLYPCAAGACLRVAGRRRRRRAPAVRRAHGGGSLRALRGAGAVPRRSEGWREQLGRPPRRARDQVPDRGPVDRVPGRVPVLGPGPGCSRRRGAVDPDRRRPLGDPAPAGPRVPDRARAQRRVHVAAELPGPRRPVHTPRTGGCSCPASWSEGSRRPAHGSRCCGRTPPRRADSGAPPSASSPGGDDDGGWSSPSAAVAEADRGRHRTDRRHRTLAATQPRAQRSDRADPRDGAAAVRSGRSTGCAGPSTGRETCSTAGRSMSWSAKPTWSCTWRS